MNQNDNSDIDTPESQLPAYFQELPQIHEKHPVNFVSYFGEILARYRRNLPKNQKNQTAFGKTLGCYFGGPVDRNRIGRAEQGDITVSFGVYAAYLSEMKMWPAILRVIEEGDGTNLRYLLLVESELGPEIDEANLESLNKLNSGMADKK